LPSNLTGSACLIPVCSECQKNYSLLKCLQNQHISEPIKIVKIGENFAEIKLPTLLVKSEECSNIPLPSSSYRIYYSNPNSPQFQCDTLSSPQTACIIEYYNEGNSGDRMFKISNLLPNTKYSVKVEVTNFYTSVEHNNTVHADFYTEEGPPGPPIDVKIEVLSPESIVLSWRQPTIVQSSDVRYEVHWQSEDFSHGVRHKGINLTDNNEYLLNYTISGLISDQLYHVWVQAFSGTGKSTENSASLKQAVRTFPNPPVAKVIGIGPRELNFTWSPNEIPSLEDYSFLIYPKGERNVSRKLTNDNLKIGIYSTNSFYHLQHLSPGICYIIKVVIRYTPGGQFYEWPNSETICYTTLIDKPLAPGIPIISVTSQYTEVIVTWKENDQNIEAYELQMKLIKEDETDHNADNYDGWTSLDNNILTNQYSISIMYSGNYTFRVRARNQFDWGNFSLASHPQDIDRIRQSQLLYAQSGQVTIGAICAGIIGFVLIVCAVYCLLVKNQSFISRKKKSLLGGFVIKQTDRELEDLREFPIRHGFIDANNPMYQVELPSDEELALIPKIKRSQITLTKFLGSGAFGEVFEGLVKDAEGSDGLEMKIAVKTLRKGAADSEKAEFLKEAKLMWNFKHEHILNLNAICLDNDPNFLILELMEGGDLLSYLRNNRPKGLIQSISLLDLVQMCLDVAKGKVT
jgi:proto-oncogene tyrosine-protein kinase ROS